MKIFLFAFALLATAAAHADSAQSIDCDYDWDFVHEFHIIIDKGAPVDSAPYQFHVEVAFISPSRVINPPVQYQAEIMGLRTFQTRVGTETNYSIDFENGNKLAFSETIDYLNPSPDSGLHGTYTENDGKPEAITCTSEPQSN